MNIPKRFLPGLVGVLFMLLGSTAWCAENQKITVEAEGVGITRMDALKEAWTIAVRKAVGLSTVANTKVIDDKLTEEIVEYSRGQVDSFEILDSSHANGIWRVKIKANVDREMLEQTVAPDKDNVVKIDGSQLAAQLQTNQRRIEDESSIVKSSKLLDFSHCFEHKASLVTYNIDGRETLFMKHIFKMNLHKFNRQAKELEKLLAKVARSKKVGDTLKREFSEIALKVIGMHDYNIKFNWEKIGEVFDTDGWGHKFESGKVDFIYLLNKMGDVPSYAYFDSYARKYVYSMNIDDGAFSNEFKLDDQDIFANSGQFLTNAFFWIDPDFYPYDFELYNQFCFYKTPSSIACYRFNDILDFLYKFSQKWKLYLLCETGEAPHKTLAQSEFNISFPPKNVVAEEIGGNMVIIVPALNLEEKQVPLILCWQKINVTPEELQNIKSLRVRYELVPND